MSAKWTIMVYMGADEGLANFAVESLKQLKDSSSPEVVVMAQLGVGYLKEEPIPLPRRYKFNREGSSARSINDKMFRANQQPKAGTFMTQKESLREFIKWAYSDSPAENYALVLWGHGPELCYQTPNGGRERLYFTPQELRSAIQDAGVNKKLSLIGMDACSMSTFEFAFELRDLAEFMIASQDEVSDFSFPYGTMLEKFKSGKFKDPRDLSKACVQDFINEYQDCFYSLQTGMRPPSLAALRLGEEGIAKIEKPLAELVNALKSSATQKMDEAIKKARECSQGFVGGLFVDLFDFCQALAEKQPDMKDQCKRVCNVICENVVTDCMVAQGATNRDSYHGISVYFPYLKSDERKDINDFDLLKGAGGSQADTLGKGAGGSQADTLGKGAGGSQADTLGKGAGGSQADTLGKGAGGSQADTLGKGAGGSQADTLGKNVVNSMARNVQYQVRQALIQDFEEFASKSDFAKTGWYSFIQNQWSRILATHDPRTLDQVYSGMQCAINLLQQTRRHSLEQAA